MLPLESSLQTYFLPVIGLVDAEKLKPGDLVVSGGPEPRPGFATEVSPTDLLSRCPRPRSSCPLISAEQPCLILPTCS